MSICRLAKSLTLSCLLLLFLPFCKKEKFISINGRLLVSNTYPVPVRNHQLSFYQAGGPSIPFPIIINPGEGQAITNNNGEFSSKFSVGSTTFIIFPGTNSGPIHMSAEAINGFPRFQISNIPSEMGTVFLYKKIDSAILNLNSLTTVISVSDSLVIRYYDPTGLKVKIKTGLNIPAGSNMFVFDTLVNLVLPSYDFSQKKYQNQVSITLIKPGLGHVGYLSPPLNDSIGPGDETRRSLLYYLQ